MMSIPGITAVERPERGHASAIRSQMIAIRLTPWDVPPA